MTNEQMQRIADRLRQLGFTAKADRLEQRIREGSDAAQEKFVEGGVPSEREG